MKTIFTFFCLFAGFIASAQTTFKVKATGYLAAEFSQILQLSDGSLISVGYTYNLETKINSSLLVKTDSMGKLLASKAFVTSSRTSSIAKTSDGGVILCASSDKNDTIILIKLNSALSIQWQKQYSTTNSNVTAYKIIQTDDEGYLIAGAIYSSDSKENAGSIIKTDSQGNIVFSKSYFDYTDYTILDIVSMRDGNLVFLAASGERTENRTPFVVKIKQDGSIIWAKQVDNNGEYMEPTALIATSDGGVVVTGDFYADMDNDELLMMIKYNSEGIAVWSKAVSTPAESESFAYAVTEDRDGYVFIGGLLVYDTGSDATEYVYAVKTDTSGALKWTRTFKNFSNDYALLYSIVPTINGYAACGRKGDGNSLTGSIYKYNNDFQICGETADNTGIMINYGNSMPITVTTGDVALISSSSNVSIANIGTTEYICSSNALPLQLLTFNATLQNKTVAVQWTTANEVNTSYFIVERSKDATTFSTLQQVAARSNSIGIQTYTATDLQPLPGTSYYRLKEVDKDGKVTHSSIVPVTVLNNGVVVISPNPVRDAIKVVMQSAGNSRVTLQVVDMKGTIMAAQKTSVVAGRNEMVIPAASLARGVYVLKVIQNNAIQTIRFVKE